MRETVCVCACERDRERASARAPLSSELTYSSSSLPRSLHTARSRNCPALMAVRQTETDRQQTQREKDLHSFAQLPSADGRCRRLVLKHSAQSRQVLRHQDLLQQRTRTLTDAPASLFLWLICVPASLSCPAPPRGMEPVHGCVSQWVRVTDSTLVGIACRWHRGADQEHTSHGRRRRRAAGVQLHFEGLVSGSNDSALPKTLKGKGCQAHRRSSKTTW